MTTAMTLERAREAVGQRWRDPGVRGGRQARRRGLERWFAHHKLALWRGCYLGVPAAVLGTVCLVCGLLALPALLFL